MKSKNPVPAIITQLENWVASKTKAGSVTPQPEPVAPVKPAVPSPAEQTEESDYR